MTRLAWCLFALLAWGLPAPVPAAPFVRATVMQLAPDEFRYDFVVENPDPEPLILVTVTGVPAGPPGIIDGLAAPPGFNASYDTGLGILDLIEGEEVFPGGMRRDGFHFFSSVGPSGFDLGGFEAWTDELGPVIGDVVLDDSFNQVFRDSFE